MNSALDRLPRGMRATIAATLELGEDVLEVFKTRGFGANALVCTPTRALISKRTDLVRWSVGVFPYSEIAAVEIIDGRPGATQVALAALEPDAPRSPKPFEEFPDAYYQESRRLVAANTVMFRNRRRAREAVEILEGLIAENRDR